MSRALSIVLVLLLVLRGLLGNAMAMGAAPVMAPAASATASALHHHAPEMAQSLAHAGMAADGHEHPAQASPHAGHGTGCASPADGSAAGSCGEHEHGPSCTLCGICHSALFTPGQMETGGISSTAALRPQGSARFASAAKLQAIKPPIS